MRTVRSPACSVGLDRLTIPVAIPVRDDPWSKRGLDLLVAGLGFLLALPVGLLIALAITLDDGGPVFRREPRWGRAGRAFLILKFRTAALSPDQPGAVRSPTGDRFFSRVGQFLRAHGLDELPQLLNVWRGDMSLVGPRPLAVAEIPAHLHPELLSEAGLAGFLERLTVRPGLTGLAQIYGSKYLRHRQKFRYDALYLRRRGWWLDVRLLLLSLRLSVAGRWEMRAKKL